MLSPQMSLLSSQMSLLSTQTSVMSTPISVLSTPMSVVSTPIDLKTPAVLQPVAPLNRPRCPVPNAAAPPNRKALLEAMETGGNGNRALYLKVGGAKPRNKADEPGFLVPSETRAATCCLGCAAIAATEDGGAKPLVHRTAQEFAEALCGMHRLTIGNMRIIRLIDNADRHSITSVIKIHPLPKPIDNHDSCEVDSLQT